ncbi:unnamed protein product, partial [Didymodactylos carnosus]
ERENLAHRNPCFNRNKRLANFVSLTLRMISSQQKPGQINDACGYNQPSCCTKEIMNSYSASIINELKSLPEKRLTDLTGLLSNTRNQIELWSIDHFNVIKRLTEQSMETLFGTYEYRHHIHRSIEQLFNSLKSEKSDEVHKSATSLFKHMIISTYRRFMMNGNYVEYNGRFTDEFRSCLTTKGFEIDVFPSQREILYILSSGSTILNILRTMLTYIDSDIYRLKNYDFTTFNENLNDCTQKYSLSALCPVCSSNNINTSVCYQDCRQFIQQCISTSNQNPYISYAMKAKEYATVLKEMQNSIIELKLLERLSKLHIYLYDMVVNATNNVQTYKRLQIECPNEKSREFTRIETLPPVMNERQDLVYKWNTSVHRVINNLYHNLENLNVTLEQAQLGICKNIKYATESSECSSINNDTRWTSQIKQQKSITLSIENDIIEYTRNQVKELSKKMELVTAIVISLRPKKMPSFIDIPDFESYDDSSKIIDNIAHDTPSSISENSYRNFELNEPMNESFSNQIYQRIEEDVSENKLRTPTTSRFYGGSTGTKRYFYSITSTKPRQDKIANSSPESMD